MINVYSAMMIHRNDYTLCAINPSITRDEEEQEEAAANVTILFLKRIGFILRELAHMLTCRVILNRSVITSPCSYVPLHTAFIQDKNAMPMPFSVFDKV